MAASAAIHGLFIFYVWNRLSLPAGTIRTAEVSIELVTAAPAVAGSQPQKPAPTAAPQPISRPAHVREKVAAPALKPATIEPRANAPAKAVEQGVSVQPRVATNDILSARHTIRSTAGSRSEDKHHKRELVRSRLEAYKFYPASARRRGIEGEVELGFALNSKGLADGVMILASSGYAILDRAAMQTVHRAQPFPIFGGKYRVRLRFRRL